MCKEGKQKVSIKLLGMLETVLIRLEIKLVGLGSHDDENLLSQPCYQPPISKESVSKTVPLLQDSLTSVHGAALPSGTGRHACTMC